MTLDEINTLKTKISPYVLTWKNPPYTLFQAKLSSYTITAYQSGKVVYQGSDLSFLESDASKNETELLFPQAGSDEVGTGDYFGPIVVAACIVSEKSSQKLKAYGITDSKKMNDLYILEIEKEIKDLCPHSILILSDAKYNRIHESQNLVEIKCKLHNQAYLNLLKKGFELPSLCVVDQFVQEKSYYRYLKNEEEVVRSLYFETKAEAKYLAVACASVLARATFLKVMKAMDQKYDFIFPKGAGSIVDQKAQEFVDRFGFSQLKEVAKLHFKNTEKLKR